MLVRFVCLIIFTASWAEHWTLQDTDHLHIFQSLYFDFIIVNAEVLYVARLV